MSATSPQFAVADAVIKHAAIVCGAPAGAVADFMQDALSDVPWLARAVNAVLDLHRGEYDEHSDGNRCAECLAEYPCPTVRAIEEATP